MPIATPFTALGAGNGFASCLSKVDVSSYDYWTTFSGVNKDSPATSDLLIAESIQLGMKLYWNGFSCVAPSRATFSSEREPPLPYESSSVSYLDVSSHSTAEPMKRVCGKFISASDSQTSSPSGRTNCQLFLAIDAPVRMYNGDITDEDNFVGIGYGMGSPVNTRGSSSARANTRVTIVGHLDESPSTTGTYDYAYVEVGGMHFVCEALAKGNVSETANAANLTASAAATVSVNTHTSNSSITSIDFYTY